jgi:hypothetical protein
MGREGDSSRAANVRDLSVVGVPFVIRDSVLGVCLSDETVQQGAAGNELFAATAI